MQDKLIIIAIVLCIGFSGGWTLNGWRHSKIRADLEICKSNTTNLMEAIQSQNRKVLELRDESKARKEAAESALKAAEKEIKILRQTRSVIENSEGESCQDAEKLINEALGL